MACPLQGTPGTRECNRSLCARLLLGKRACGHSPQPCSPPGKLALQSGGSLVPQFTRPRSRGGCPRGSQSQEDVCVYRALFHRGYNSYPCVSPNLVLPSLSTPFPVPRPRPSLPLVGAVPRAPRSCPKRKSVSSTSKAGSYRMFLPECFGFHVAECSSLISHISAAGSPPPFPPSGLAILWPKPCVDLPSPLPYAGSAHTTPSAEQHMPRSPEAQTGNYPNSPTADAFQNERSRGSRNMTACGPQHDEAGEDRHRSEGLHRILPWPLRRKTQLSIHLAPTPPLLAAE